MSTNSLHTTVLVLNKYFQAVQITSVRRAFSLFYKGDVKAVDEQYATYSFDDWLELPANGDSVRTPSQVVRIPRVIQLLSYDKLPRVRIRFSRRNVFLRDRFICQYCGGKFDEKDLTIDHIVPRSRGGKTTWENVATCCFHCNNRKGDLTPAESGTPLLRKSRKPHWIPFTRFARHKNPHPIWKEFTDLAYSATPLDDES